MIRIHFRRDATTDEAKLDHFVATLLDESDGTLARVHGDSRYRCVHNLLEHIEPALDELDRRDDQAEADFDNPDTSSES